MLSYPPSSPIRRGWRFEEPGHRQPPQAGTPPDVFAEAKDRISIADAWTMLSLPGEPKPSCRSPFRDDTSPSFSIHSDGRKWKDHATGEGGDVIEFARCAFNGASHAELRQWFAERLGHATTGATPSRTATRRQTTKPADPPKAIRWPGELIEGNPGTWTAFAERWQLTFPGVHAAVAGGLLRFTLAGGKKCFVLTDPARRNAEIRRCDGRPFASGEKLFRLSGIEKSWPLGSTYLIGTEADRRVLLCEGATDWLAAFCHYSRFRRAGGTARWMPLGVLGAACKTLHVDVIPLIRGRHVRIMPDGDKAGDAMCEHWGAMLAGIGCTAEAVAMPRGRDLRDMIEGGEIGPEELFA